MNRNFKFFIGAVLTVLYLSTSLLASTETKDNTYKNSSLVQFKGGSNNCPCPDDDPTIFLDDTCGCEDDGSGGPWVPPDDKD